MHALKYISRSYIKVTRENLSEVYTDIVECGQEPVSTLGEQCESCVCMSTYFSKSTMSIFAARLSE
jgi:hypothetical protein